MLKNIEILAIAAYAAAIAKKSICQHILPPFALCIDYRLSFLLLGILIIGL